MQIDLHVNLEKLEHERHQAENSPPCVFQQLPTVPQCSQSRLLNYD